MAPFEHSSGTSIRGKTKTSNLANREVKVYLTRAAITAISWDPQIKAYYKRKTGEGKHKASVINAVRAKIIARCFAVIKRKLHCVTLRCIGAVTLREGKIIFLFESLSRITRFLKRKRSCGGEENRNKNTFYHDFLH